MASGGRQLTNSAAPALDANLLVFAFALGKLVVVGLFAWRVVLLIRSGARRTVILAHLALLAGVVLSTWFAWSRLLN